MTKITIELEAKWTFNGGEPPKFWFGDYVYCPAIGRTGEVVGIVWQKNNPSRTDGWWYWVKNDYSLVDFHERNLELDNDF